MKRAVRRLRNNVYAKLLILFLTIAIVPSILASVLSYWVSLDNAINQSHRFSERLLTEMRSSNDIAYEEMQSFIYELMTQYDYYSETLAKSPYTADYLSVRSMLDNKRQAYQKRIKSFSIIDLQSGKIMSAYNGLAVYDIEDYRTQPDGSLIDMAFSEEVSSNTNDIRLRRSGDKDVLTYIYKYGPANHLKGYITVDIELSQISLSDSVQGNGDLFVRNSHGMLLTNQRKEVYDAINSGRTRSQYMVISEVSNISGLQYDYVILKQNIVKNNRILLWSIFSICIGLILLGSLAAWLSSRNIYTPLQNLLRYIRQLSGDRSRTAGEEKKGYGVNDFNYLERAFTSLSQEKAQYLNAIRSNQGMFKQRQLSLLLSGNVGAYESLEVPDKFRLAYTFPDYLVLVIELEHVEEFREKYTSLEQELLYFAIQNITEETLGEAGSASCCRMETHRVTAVLNYESEKSGPERTNELCKQIQTRVEQFLHLQVSIGISGTAGDRKLIKACYDQAVRAVSYKVYFGRNSVVYYPNLSQMEEARLLDSSAVPWTEMKEKLKLDFRANDWERIELSIRQIIEKISYVGITRTDLQLVFLQFMSCLSDICFEFSLPLSGVFGEHFYINRAASHLTTVEDLQKDMLSLARQLSGKLEEKKSHLHQEMIESILIRIQENIDKNITIESIAESVFLHPSYLSRICKTITGISLGEQFVLAKINKAKEWLANSSTSVGDIAERLGYTTPRAFYRIFKDYTGMTPSDYRKQESIRKISRPED